MFHVSFPSDCYSPTGLLLSFSGDSSSKQSMADRSRWKTNISIAFSVASIKKCPQIVLSTGFPDWHKVAPEHLEGHTLTLCGQCSPGNSYIIIWKPPSYNTMEWRSQSSGIICFLPKWLIKCHDGCDVMLLMKSVKVRDSIYHQTSYKDISREKEEGEANTEVE